MYHDTRRNFTVYFRRCYGSQLFVDISSDLPTFLDRAPQSEYKTTNSFSINKLRSQFFVEIFDYAISFSLDKSSFYSDVESIKTDLLQDLINDSLMKLNTGHQKNTLICLDEFFTGTNEYVYRDMMMTVLRTIKFMCPESWLIIATHDSMLKSVFKNLFKHKKPQFIKPIILNGLFRMQYPTSFYFFFS